MTAHSSAQTSPHLSADAFGSGNGGAGYAVSPEAPGLSVIWRIDGPWHDSPVPVRSVQAFSPDGRWLGVLDDDGVKAIDAAGARTLRSMAHLFGRQAHSVAVSSAGRIAVGRAGGIHVYEPGTPRPIWISCFDPCGPVQALAFSPDERLLAYQGTRGLDARRRGLGSIVVLDVATKEPVARLSAPAAKAYVAFSADGTRLSASAATSFDDVEQYGLRVWDTADWMLERQLPGSPHWWRAIGLVDGRHVGAYLGDGQLELRDLESGQRLWSAPLIAPSLDSTRATDDVATRLDLIEFAPNGEFVVSYESPSTLPYNGSDRRIGGAIVIRETTRGSVEAMYDVIGVTSLAVAPDSASFVYGTGAGRTHRVMARVPH